jgi:hypothetical protein
MIMLPTILFMLAAYVIYALVMAWCHRQRYGFPGRAQARPRWLTLAKGVFVLGLALWFIFWLNPVTPDQQMRMAGMLGVTEGEALQASQAAPRVSGPHLKEKGTGGQPAYAMLHPESPPSLLPPAKPPAGTQVRKLIGKRPQTPGVKSPPKESNLTPNDKAAGKVKAKKKKPSRSSAKPSASFQDNSG